MTVLDEANTTAMQHLWPDHGLAVRRPVPSVALGAGLLGAVLVAGNPLGLGVFLAGVAIIAAVLPVRRHRLTAHEITYLSLAVLLLAAVVVRDAPWYVALCLLGTLASSSYALAPGRSLVAGVLGAMSLPLAGLRSLPWLRRGLGRFDSRAGRQTWLALRVALLTGVLLACFGALFATADAAFAALLPTVGLGELPLRLIVLVVVTGLALSLAFLAAAPPRWDVITPGRARPVRPVEWIVPIAMLDVLVATFVAVQLTVLFGGDRHVLTTEGLTYAEYARGGFGQLVLSTMLTLTVVAAAVRWAPRETARDRLILRSLLGLLCALSLVIVASAVHRLDLYEHAFGFTRLRLFMNVFELWLGLLVLLVLAAGVRLRARWLPRAVVASAAVALLALGAVNPDGLVAERNVDRYLSTGSIDVSYLQQLSADALPAIATLPPPARSCVLDGITPVYERSSTGFLARIGGWNFGRHHARTAVDRAPTSSSPRAPCPVATTP